MSISDTYYDIDGDFYNYYSENQKSDGKYFEDALEGIKNEYPINTVAIVSIITISGIALAIAALGITSLLHHFHVIHILPAALQLGLPASISLIAVPLASGLIIVSIPSYVFHKDSAMRNEAFESMTEAKDHYNEALARVTRVEKPNQNVLDYISTKIPQELSECCLQIKMTIRFAQMTYALAIKDRQGHLLQTPPVSTPEELQPFRTYYEHCLKYTDAEELDELQNLEPLSGLDAISYEISNMKNQSFLEITRTPFNVQYADYIFVIKLPEGSVMQRANLTYDALVSFRNYYQYHLDYAMGGKYDLSTNRNGSVSVEERI